MRRTFRQTTPLLRCLLCALLALGPLEAVQADGDTERGRGWWGDLDRGEVVDLADVIADPRRFTGREVTFFCIFRAKDDVFVPQGTIFSRRKFTNLSVWPDGTPLWEQSTYQKAEFPFLYVQRTHFQRDELVRLPRFTRIEVTGRIRSIVRDKPFVELTSWRETSHRLGREVVDAMAWGDIYARGGKTELAAAKYQEALAVDLPPLYDMAIRKRAADALRKLGYPDYADEIERGETMGGTAMPEPTNPAARPGTPPAGFADPEGAAPTEFATAQPDVGFAPPTGTQRPGGAPTATPEARPAGSRNPFMSDDLPGQPMGSGGNTARAPTGVRPMGADLPGTPMNDLPGEPMNDLPGEPMNDLPGEPARARPKTQPQAAPATAPKNPFLSDDLPGVPSSDDGLPKKVTPALRLPGAAPVSETTATPPDDPLAPPTAARPATPPASAAPKKQRSPRPVLPPSRQPRLAGFK